MKIKANCELKLISANIEFEEPASRILFQAKLTLPGSSKDVSETFNVCFYLNDDPRIKPVKKFIEELIGTEVEHYYNLGEKEGRNEKSRTNHHV